MCVCVWEGVVVVSTRDTRFLLRNEDDDDDDDDGGGGDVNRAQKRKEKRHIIRNPFEVNATKRIKIKNVSIVFSCAKCGSIRPTEMLYICCKG